MKKLLSYSAILAIGAFGLVGCTIAPLQEPPSEYIYQASSDNLHKAIIEAAQARSWAIKKDLPGKVQLTYPTGAKRSKFEVTVDVEYKNGQYQVKYVSSYGLDEKTGCKNNWEQRCIHRNVNRWMNNLSNDIRRFYQTKQS